MGTYKVLIFHSHYSKLTPIKVNSKYHEPKIF